MSRGDELYTALGDGAGGNGFLLGAHFVDDDYLGHVIFHRLNHHGMLLAGSGHLHAAGVADGRMGYIPVAGDFIGGINDYHSLLGFVGQHPGYLTQHGGFAYAGAAQQQDVPTGKGQVLYDFDGAVDGPAHAAGDAHHLAFAIADRGYPVQRALNPGPIIAAKIADSLDHVIQIVPGNFLLIQGYVAGHQAGFGNPPQIQDHFQELSQVFPLAQRLGNP